MINAPKLIILHCADTPDYPEGSPEFDRFGASDIDAWHKERGWDCIGYHYVVRRTGVVEKGRAEDRMGAHCYGHNDGTLGVCYVGRKSPTKAQWQAILRLSQDFKTRLGIDPGTWMGHYEFNPAKTCPGLDMTQVRKSLADDVTDFI